MTFQVKVIISVYNIIRGFLGEATCTISTNFVSKKSTMFDEFGVGQSLKSYLSILTKEHQFRKVVHKNSEEFQSFGRYRYSTLKTGAYKI